MLIEASVSFQLFLNYEKFNPFGKGGNGLKTKKISNRFRFIQKTRWIFSICLHCLLLTIVLPYLDLGAQLQIPIRNPLETRPNRQQIFTTILSFKQLPFTCHSNDVLWAPVMLKIVVSCRLAIGILFAGGW